MDCPISYAVATCNIMLVDGGNHRSAFRVLVRHGVGGARTETGDMNKMVKELQTYQGIDLLASGHTHHSYVHKMRPQLAFTAQGHCYSRAQHICRTGTFKRNMLDDPLKPSYEEEAGYSAAGLGYSKFRLWLDRKESKDEGTVYSVKAEGAAVGID